MYWQNHFLANLTWRELHILVLFKPNFVQSYCIAQRS